jgi:ABC-type nickel/cobalt efflux system permease component RcnA
VTLLLANMQLCSTDCLVGVPNAMINGRRMSVHEVEDEMRENAQAVMLHCAIYLGVRTYRKDMSWHVQQSVRYCYYSVPWYSSHETCTCAYVTHSSERCVKIIK